MVGSWLIPRYLDPFDICPFIGRERYFDNFNRLNHRPEVFIINSRNSTDKDLSEVPKLIESCPEIIDNEKEFRIKMDVSLFAPSELKTSINGKCLIVEGEHEEKDEGYGTIKRSFIRKYALPKGITEKNITCELTKDGILTVGGIKDEIEKVKNISIKCNK
uniref:SHSP domain-containing protein n=1 Tax=Strongyloides papillosus TaxID=174720 RepID=A0A0N5BVF7_STREA